MQDTRGESVRLSQCMTLTQSGGQLCLRVPTEKGPLGKVSAELTRLAGKAWPRFQPQGEGASQRMVPTGP